MNIKHLDRNLNFIFHSVSCANNSCTSKASWVCSCWSGTRYKNKIQYTLFFSSPLLKIGTEDFSNKPVHIAQFRSGGTPRLEVGAFWHPLQQSPTRDYEVQRKRETRKGRRIKIVYFYLGFWEAPGLYRHCSSYRRGVAEFPLERQENKKKTSPDILLFLNIYH